MPFSSSPEARLTGATHNSQKALDVNTARTKTEPTAASIQTQQSSTTEKEWGYPRTTYISYSIPGWSDLNKNVNNTLLSSTSASCYMPADSVNPKRAATSATPSPSLTFSTSMSPSTGCCPPLNLDNTSNDGGKSIDKKNEKIDLHGASQSYFASLQKCHHTPMLPRPAEAPPSSLNTSEQYTALSSSRLREPSTSSAASTPIPSQNTAVRKYASFSTAASSLVQFNRSSYTSVISPPTVTTSRSTLMPNSVSQLLTPPCKITLTPYIGTTSTTTAVLSNKSSSSTSSSPQQCCPAPSFSILEDPFMGEPFSLSRTSSSTQSHSISALAPALSGAEAYPPILQLCPNASGMKEFSSTRNGRGNEAKVLSALSTSSLSVGQIHSSLSASDSQESTERKACEQASNLSSSTAVSILGAAVTYTSSPARPVVIGLGLIDDATPRCSQARGSASVSADKICNEIEEEDWTAYSVLRPEQPARPPVSSAPNSCHDDVSSHVHGDAPCTEDQCEDGDASGFRPTAMASASLSLAAQAVQSSAGWNMAAMESGESDLESEDTETDDDEPLSISEQDENGNDVNTTTIQEIARQRQQLENAVHYADESVDIDSLGSTLNIDESHSTLQLSVTESVSDDDDPPAAITDSGTADKVPKSPPPMPREYTEKLEAIKTLKSDILNMPIQEIGYRIPSPVSISAFCPRAVTAHATIGSLYPPGLHTNNERLLAGAALYWLWTGVFDAETPPFLAALWHAAACPSLCRAGHQREKRVEDTEMVDAIRHGHRECVARLVYRGLDVNCDLPPRPMYSPPAPPAPAAVNGAGAPLPVIPMGPPPAPIPIAGPLQPNLLLHVAIRCESYGAAEVLLQAGVRMDTQDNNAGFTPLHAIALGGPSEFLRFVLSSVNEDERRKLVQARSRQGLTPLHMARNAGLAELLLSAGSELEAVGARGETPLYTAAQYGRADVVKLLLGYGANIEARHSEGWTPLHTAVGNGSRGEQCYQDCVQLLLEAGADPNAGDKDGDTALHAAAYKGIVPMAQLLLAGGADPNRRNAGGAARSDFRSGTPLHCAAKRGHIQMVLFLAEVSDINARNCEGQTALHVAAEAGLRTVFQLLISLEADSSIRDDNGMRARDLGCVGSQF